MGSGADRDAEIRELIVGHWEASEREDETEHAIYADDGIQGGGGLWVSAAPGRAALAEPMDRV